MSILRIALYVEISNLLLIKLVYVLKVDKENLVYKVDLAKIMNVDFKTQVIFCRLKAQFSMSALRPKSICININCVDLLNFDLNNSTRNPRSHLNSLNSKRRAANKFTFKLGCSQKMLQISNSQPINQNTNCF
jgi:hypothetical protein